MGKVVVMYQSKYGAAKRYAEWLAETLDCALLETKKAVFEEIKEYDTIILGGGIYASGIAGVSFLKKHYPKLKDKKVLVFAVGASPYDENAMEELKKRNLSGALAQIPLFYCRGAWKESDMSWKDRALCGVLKKAVSKKDPADFEPWEAALMESIRSDCDWTDKKNLEPIIAYIQ